MYKISTIIVALHNNHVVVHNYRLSLSTEEGLTLKLLAPLKINLLKLKLLCKDYAKCIQIVMHN
jgi:hypothetical protein